MVNKWSFLGDYKLVGVDNFKRYKFVWPKQKAGWKYWINFFKFSDGWNIKWGWRKCTSKSKIAKPLFCGDLKEKKNRNRPFLKLHFEEKKADFICLDFGSEDSEFLRLDLDGKKRRKRSAPKSTVDEKGKNNNGLGGVVSRENSFDVDSAEVSAFEEKLERLSWSKLGFDVWNEIEDIAETKCPYNMCSVCEYLPVSP